MQGLKTMLTLVVKLGDSDMSLLCSWSLLLQFLHAGCLTVVNEGLLLLVNGNAFFFKLDSTKGMECLHFQEIVIFSYNPPGAGGWLPSCWQALPFKVLTKSIPLDSKQVASSY